VDAGVVVDGGVGVFEFVAGEDADYFFVGGDELFAKKLAVAGDAGGAGGFAAEAVAADQGLVLQNIFVGHFADDAIHDLQGAERFGEVDGAADLDSAGDGVRGVVAFIHGGGGGGGAGVVEV